MSKQILLFLVFFGALPISNAYAQQIKAPVEKREIAMTLLNLDENDPNHGMRWIREMNSEGATVVIMTVRWDMVYADANAKADWALFDKQIKLISELGMKAGIRIHLGRKRLKWEGFWDDNNIMRDFLGVPSIWGYAESHASYASELSTQKAISFIKEVCERYEPYQEKGNVLFVNISSTQDQEAGYYYQNQKEGSTTTYLSLYDYSKPSMDDLRRRMEKKYTNVVTLNNYWNTKYTKFDQVAPYVSPLNPKISLIGKRGKDFFMARHFQLKDYLKACGDAVKEVNAGYKICYDFGSMTDSGSDLRGTLNATSLSEHCDILKHNDEDPDWSFDILAHNVTKPIYNEIYAYDRYTNQDMVNLTNWFFENGSSLVAYLVADEKQLGRFKEVLFQTRRWLNEPITPIVAEKQMDIYVSQLIDSYKTVFDRWKNISNNGSIKVAINLKEDIIANEEIEVLPYQSPEELAVLYGYYNPDANTNQGTGGNNSGGRPPVGNNGGIDDALNSVPFVLRKFTPEPIIVKEFFLTFLDNDIFLDNDGYIASMELISGPEWLKFNPQGLYFTGQPPEVGEFEVRLRAYDNRGAWIEDSFVFEVVTPRIDFSLIEANYFDVPINIWTDLTDNKVLYINEIPALVNIMGRCNVDSIDMKFELTGPFYKSNLAERLPFSAFGDGRGFAPPEGKYTLTATALVKDSVVTQNTISFTMLASRNSDEPVQWLTYPNPFLDVCNVKIPTDIDATKVSYNLIDLSGRTTEIDKSQVTVFNQTSYIDLRKNQLQQGTYFIQATVNGEKLFQSKIVKK